MALPMTGHLWPSSCKLDMVLPHGEALVAGRAEVDRARRVAGEADFRNGHMALDWRRMVSMILPVSRFRNELVCYGTRTLESVGK